MGEAFRLCLGRWVEMSPFKQANQNIECNFQKPANRRLGAVGRGRQEIQDEHSKTNSLTVELTATSRGKEACRIGFKMKVN